MADQNIFGTFGKAKELRQRIFLLGILIIYRLGTYIPVPGINPTVLNEIVNQTSGGVLGMFNMFSEVLWKNDNLCFDDNTIYIRFNYHAINEFIVTQIAQLKKEGETGYRL